MTARRIQEHDAAGTPAGTELLPAAQLSTTVTRTATDISAVAASNKFVRGSGSWITDGFAVGQSVKSSGWTGGTANNRTARTITVLTATDMTFGGTDGDDIVDDAGGESVTITAWEPVRMTAQEVADLGGSGVSDAADVTYTPADASDWNSSADPGDVQEAIDQLATRAKALEDAGPGSGTKTIAIFTPMTSQPPASNMATLDTRNSIAVLDFDAGTDESAFWVGIIPEGADLTSGVKVRIHWMATSATSGTCRWGAQIERMSTDLDSDSFDTAATAGGTANGTSGILTATEITLTTIDSVAAGEPYRLKVYRDADGTSGTDDMTGDAELVCVEVRTAA